jgi:hypothetical protein
VLNLATIFDREDYVRSYPKGSVLFAEGEVGEAPSFSLTVMAAMAERLRRRTHP